MDSDVNQHDVEDDGEYDIDDDREQDPHFNMMRSYIAHLSDADRNKYTYAMAASLKRTQGIDAKRFMWLSDKGKREALGLNEEYKPDYEE